MKYYLLILTMDVEFTDISSFVFLPHLINLCLLLCLSMCVCLYIRKNLLSSKLLHYSKKLKEHVDIMIFIERYPLKRCQGCVKLIASKVNCFLNITDLSEVQLCMSSNSWTWECPHTKDGADHVPLIFLSSVFDILRCYESDLYLIC